MSKSPRHDLVDVHAPRGTPSHPEKRHGHATVLAKFGLIFGFCLIVGSCGLFKGEVTDDANFDLNLDAGGSLPSTSATTPTTLTTLFDYGFVGLPRVNGRTTESSLPPGKPGTLKGVASAEGGAGGGVVRLERIVGDSLVPTDVPIGSDGSFRFTGVPGGRYRIRAWRQPDLALTSPLVFFFDTTKSPATVNLEDGSSLAADGIKVELLAASGVEARISTGPSIPVPGEVAILSVRVGARVLDGDGYLSLSPMVDTPVSIVSSNGWTFQEAGGVTDAEGVAGWYGTCLIEGPTSVTLLVGDQSVTATGPTCRYAAALPSPSLLDPTETPRAPDSPTPFTPDGLPPDRPVLPAQ